jgi:membrane-bound ClpP family serine protease
MISDPNFAVLLVCAGVLGIYVELWRLGWVVPGVVGGVAVLVGLASLWNGAGWATWGWWAVVPVVGVGAWMGRIAVRARAGKRVGKNLPE